MPGPRNRPRPNKTKKKKIVVDINPPSELTATPPFPGLEFVDTIREPSPLFPEAESAPPVEPVSLEVPIKPIAPRPNYRRPEGWDGPHLSGMHDFLSTRYADPIAYDIPGCALFASIDVFHVLQSYLSEDLALIIWYNKTRRDARVCAACQTFYHLGDNIVPPMDLGFQFPDADVLDEREKRNSGICSMACFAISTYNFAGGIQAWGKLQRELDAETARSFDFSQPVVDDEGLGTLVRLTRLPDVGVAHYVADELRYKLGDLPALEEFARRLVSPPSDI